MLWSHHEELTALGRRIWLWLESRRLGRQFVTPRDYTLSRLNKCPETAGWRNCLVNLHARGTRALRPLCWRRHPRERVLNALAWLLWEPDASGANGSLVQLQKELGVKACSFVELVSAYRSFWQHFN
jgi:hypothetical protein